ncbi:hypothetical protein C1A50_4506 [Paenibacillus polymyxa]|nr:hypothetical protein C1A50_4506 [Paenibacillus polymyxa]
MLVLLPASLGSALLSWPQPVRATNVSVSKMAVSDSLRDIL